MNPKIRKASEDEKKERCLWCKRIDMEKCKGQQRWCKKHEEYVLASDICDERN